MNLTNVRAVLLRWRRACVGDLLLTLAAAVGAIWYASILPPGTVSVLMMVCGYGFLACAGLLVLSALVEATAISIGRGRRGAPS